MSPEIQLINGEYFHFDHPAFAQFDISAVAHALSNICRFNGHSVTFYSVAQHCVLVSHLVPPKHAMAGLLHDAHEAFVGDVTAPLKQLLPDFQAVERRVQNAVLQRFGIKQLPRCVKDADLIALATEQRDLMPEGDVWRELRDGGHWPHGEHIEPWSAAKAKIKFLERFHQLKRGEVA